MEQLTEMGADRRQSAVRRMGERPDAKGKRTGASTTGGKASSRGESKRQYGYAWPQIVKEGLDSSFSVSSSKKDNWYGKFCEDGKQGLYF